MTNNPTPQNDENIDPAPWSEATDPDGYTLKDIRPKDYEFNALLNFYFGFDDEYPDGSIGLTVASNGVVVSGAAISRTAWSAALVDQVRQGGGDATAPHVEKIYNEIQAIKTEGAQKRRDQDLPERARRFLHMKNARLIAGGETINVPLWRGSLSDISGWSMGTATPQA
ncbi:hypothetical protein VH571_15005 [Frondihabitans sp. 4ASC-45]|uniref:hypothetical protein n=1 Tax=Frondihabitans sp. 4ASC-45 TaxID=3111636 RepID=UPI003C148258